MGKRKSRSSSACRSMAASRRKAPKLDTEFACPFCGHPAAVECRVDRKLCLAEASCRICQETYAIRATALTEAIDVYSDWIDACEDANATTVVRA